MIHPSAAAEEVGSVGPTEPVGTSALRSRADLRGLVADLHDQHPEVAVDRITSLVEQAHAEHLTSRVQTYRMILVERSVRRLLAADLGPCGR